MSKLDFGSIYKEDKFDYIHSHAKNFNAAIDKGKDVDFAAVLQEIKDNAIKIIQEDIVEFRAMEKMLAEEQIKKFKENNIELPPALKENPNEVGLKLYMRDLRKTLETTGVNSLSSIVRIKENMIETKIIGDKIKDVSTDDVAKQIFKKKYSALTKKEKKEVDDAIQQSIKEFKQQIKKLAIGFERYLRSLINYVLSIYDPHRGIDQTESETEKTSLKQLIELFEALGINLKKTTLKDIKQSITNLGPEAFFATFLSNSAAKTLLDGIVKDFNVNSNLGTLFERSLRDRLVQTSVGILKGKALNVFDQGDIEGTGAWTDNFTQKATMDLKFAEQDNAKGKIVFGASLKLRNPGKPIDTSSSQENWNQQFEDTVNRGNRENFKFFKYSRKNIYSLFFFNKDEDTEVKASLQTLLQFEEDIIQIISLLRLLIGLYQFVDNQYKTTGMKDNKFYYTAYIFTFEETFSTADVLEAFLIDLGKRGKNKSFTAKGYKMVTPKVTKDNLEKFWKTKEKAIKKLSNSNKRISYKNIMSDQDVIEELVVLNNILQNFSFSGNIQIATTEAKIKTALGSMQRQ